MKVFALLAVILSGVAELRAQVPLVSLDLLAGAAIHNQSAGAYEYSSTFLPAIRLAAALRIASTGRTRPVLKLELDVRSPDESTLLLPQTSETIAYPATGGISGALGVEHIVTSGLGLGLAIGGGRFGGGYRGSRHNSAFGETELLWRASANTSFIVNLQYRQWRADSTRFWYSPATIGFRLF